MATAVSAISTCKRVLIGLRIDGDRLDSQFARGLDDPAGDFAAIGDQDTRLNMWPFCTASRQARNWLRITGACYTTVL